MVTIDKNKLTISIETSLPVSTLTDLQQSIITVMQNYKTDPTNDDDVTMSCLGYLLQALQPTHDQYNDLYKVEKVTNLN